MNIYILIKGETINVSYGNKASEIIPELTNVIKNNMDIDCIKNELEAKFSLKITHNLKYVYRHKKASDSKAIKLTEKHLELFMDFFKENNPHCKDYSWVDEYFNGLVQKGYCHGVIADKILVSATDAPDMPFMSEFVQEIGINTLEKYQRNGYAKMACISMIETLISKNICPIWSTGIENIGSDKLAKCIGFEKYCDVLTINIP
jgi:hypothetical protein